LATTRECGAQSAGGGPRSSNADLAALGKFALASVYRGRIKTRRAIDLYKQLMDKPTLVVRQSYRPARTRQLLRVAGQRSRMRPSKLYDQVAKENPSTEAGHPLAQRRVAALK